MNYKGIREPKWYEKCIPQFNDYSEYYKYYTVKIIKDIYGYKPSRVYKMTVEDEDYDDFYAFIIVDYINKIIVLDETLMEGLAFEFSISNSYDDFSNLGKRLIKDYEPEDNDGDRHLIVTTNQEWFVGLNVVNTYIFDYC